MTMTTQKPTEGEYTTCFDSDGKEWFLKRQWPTKPVHYDERLSLVLQHIEDARKNMVHVSGTHARLADNKLIQAVDMLNRLMR